MRTLTRAATARSRCRRPRSCSSRAFQGAQTRSPSSSSRQTRRKTFISRSNSRRSCAPSRPSFTKADRSGDGKVSLPEAKKAVANDFGEGPLKKLTLRFSWSTTERGDFYLQPKETMRCIRRLRRRGLRNRDMGCGGAHTLSLLGRPEPLGLACLLRSDDCWPGAAEKRLLRLRAGPVEGGQVETSWPGS